jgi:hypothetical protein
MTEKRKEWNRLVAAAYIARCSIKAGYASDPDCAPCIDYEILREQAMADAEDFLEVGEAFDVGAL